MRRLAVAVGLVIGFLASSAGSSAAAGSVLRESNIGPNLASLNYPYDAAFEPVAATDPRHTSVMAVAYQFQPRTGSRCGIIPALRYSKDGGSTWKTASARPWAGSGRVPNWHAAIAFGPGPTAGSSRLYWADTTDSDCTFSDHRLSISYSDDLGASWSPMFTYTGTPATPAGGFPEITVDRNPNSPNYGVVYAAINWFPNSSTEPGYRVLASANFGKSWAAAEVKPLTAPSGYPFRYRIGYRMRTAPDGRLYASFCERDRSSPTGGSGRLAFGVSALHFDRVARTLTADAPVLATRVALNSYTVGGNAAPGTTDHQLLNPCWTHGFDVDQANGDVYMAVQTYSTSAAAGTPRGVVRVGRSTDHAKTWSWHSLPSLPTISGRPQSAHKPNLVVSRGTVFVGYHGMVDVAIDSGLTKAVTVGNAYAVSYDRGATFGPPAAISGARWHPDWLDHRRNGPGLRERAELIDASTVLFVYGDGRHAAAKPDPDWGRSEIFAAVIRLGQATTSLAVRPWPI